MTRLFFVRSVPHAFLRPKCARPFVLCGLLSLIANIAPAQVAVIPNSPAYNFQVLPGSTRQINVNITGGTLNTVNWSIPATTGGASATFTTPAVSAVPSVSGAIPTVQVNIGQGTGNCTIPQVSSAIGQFTVTSPATVTVRAQSVDDPSMSANFLFNVCAKTTTVFVAPAYQQAFKGQHRTLQSWISGDTDETGTWSIISQPAGGNGLLADTVNRDTDFAATVTGRYTLQYTSHSDSSKSATAIVYVSPNSLPQYVSTPSKTEPRECHLDPALTGGIYEVGPGKAYPSLQSTPAANTLAPGSIMRIWNTDLTGSNPTTYHEYYQVAASGTPTQPILICGVPDAVGNLPVIDGDNATTQAGAHKGLSGLGIITLWPGGYGRTGIYGYWQTGSEGPSYIGITGLHLMHATPDYSYTPPGGGIPVPFNGFAACLDLRSGSYIDLGGNDLDTCGQGMFAQNNSSNAWATITQLVTLTGSHIHRCGTTGSGSEHQIYFQTWYGLLEGNLIDDYNPLAFGSSVKWRGVEGIFRYNNIGSGAARIFDLVENQDATAFVTFEGYLASPGETNCYASMYCSGDLAGPNIIAAYQESEQKDFIYGNLLFGTSAYGQIHYLADGTSGMEDRNGTLYFYSNTLDNAQVIFDNGINGSGLNGYFPPRFDARNNIFWANTVPYPGAAITMAMGRYSTVVLSAVTNLLRAGTFSIQTPLMGANISDGTAAGWSNQCDFNCLWPLSFPLDTHLYVLTSAGYLSTATRPYNATTMIPPAASAAIGAGTPLTGVLATMPVRRQYFVSSSSVIARLDPLTIGAVDYAAVAATPSFTPAAGNYGFQQTVTISTTTAAATIYYTTNGSTPTAASLLYTAPITVAATATVKAIALVTGYTPSAIGSAAYGIGPLAATPVYSPAGGTFSAVQTVTISSATPGAAIYYTVNGTTPTVASTLYSGPVVVAASETIQALAMAGGYSPSLIGSAVFVINLPSAAKPIFSLSAGTYTSVQTLTISDATPGAQIHYTTDLSNPATSATAILYTGPITVAETTTLQAVAAATNYATSAMASAAYTINLPFAGPSFVQQCNNFVQFGATISCTINGVAAGDTLVIGIANLASGQAGTATSSSGTPVLAATSNNSLSAWLLPNTAVGSITITYTVPANTRLWLSVAEYSNVAASPLDAAVATVVTTYQNNGLISTPSFTTTAPFDVLWTMCSGVNGQAGTGSTPVSWVALPTPAGGSLLVENGNTTAAGSYYGQCSANQGELITLALKAAPAPPAAATPTFSVAAGNYSTAKSVAISDATPGATIRYTTNGTVPTAVSAIYSGPVIVTATTTLKAIAIAPGFATSATASATFTINSPNVILSAKSLTRVGGNLVVILTLGNTGGGPATNVVLTSVKIGTTSATPLPAAVGTLAPGATGQVTVTVPGSAGAPGTSTSLTLIGTYTGGTFSSNARITLP